MLKTREQFEAEPLTGAMGAILHGVNIADLDDTVFDDIRASLFEYGAIAIPGQSLTLDQLKAFAARFGELETHPIVNGMENHPEIIRMHKPAGAPATFGAGWHSDNSFFARPSLGSILYAEIIPPVGGDTLFSNQQKAYEALSPGLKTTLENLTAIHSAHAAYTSPTALEKYDSDGPITYRRSDIIDQEVEHPVIIAHPITGAKALYINPMFTLKFKHWTIEESRPLIDYLCRHAARDDFQCRIRWSKGMVTMWDNRIVQHAALNDYEGHERLIYRVTVNGEALGG
ncbi:MAG: TauD/TfdA family dioxygenase [Pseudomonadota bacterium]